MAHTNPHGAPHGAPAGHETTDANVGGVEKFLVVMALFLIVAFGLMWLMYGYLRGREAAVDTRPSPAVRREGDRLPPMPRLQRNPPQDLAAFHEAEQAELDRWEWVDKAQGIAHIPIARAIDILAERGLEPPPGDTGTSGTGTAAPAQAPPARTKEGAAPATP